MVPAGMERLASVGSTGRDRRRSDLGGPTYGVVARGGGPVVFTDDRGVEASSRRPPTPTLPREGGGGPRSWTARGVGVGGRGPRGARGSEAVDRVRGGSQKPGDARGEGVRGRGPRSGRESEAGGREGVGSLSYALDREEGPCPGMGSCFGNLAAERDGRRIRGRPGSAREPQHGPRAASLLRPADRGSHANHSRPHDRRPARSTAKIPRHTRFGPR